MIRIGPIPFDEIKGWLLNKHYARRLCPVSYSFGAWDDGCLVGIVTYGTPASSPLRNGVCGSEWSDKVLELNRLCCESRKNLASMIVGRSLSLLPKPSIIVSYSDTAQSHVGYVYQATNFIYTGLSAKRTDWRVKGKEHLHGATIADESRGQSNRLEWMRQKYGCDFYLEERPRKHRYVFFCGSRKQKKEMMDALKYKKHEYPKGESKRYDASSAAESQNVLI